MFSLYQSSGIHSALRHDRIEHADDTDYLFVEKEAERVANEAINKLRQSRAECKRNGLSVPTWTGNSGPSNSSAPKKPRFGKKAQNTNIEHPIKSVQDTLQTINKKICKETNVVDISSSALLARMKSRNSAVININPAQTTVCSNSDEKSENILAKDIQEFLAQRMDGTATSDEITSFFQSRIETEQNILFKELLKQVCTFERNAGNGIWRLKEEFL